MWVQDLDISSVMHDIFLHAHRGFAYLGLLFVAVFVVVFVLSLLLVAFSYSGKITKLLRVSSLLVMITFHLQLLVGIVMLVFTSGFLDAFKDLGIAGIMKNSSLRFTYIEHPFSMILVTFLMTVLYKNIKSRDIISLRIILFSTIMLTLFIYAFQWKKLFGI